MEVLTVAGHWCMSVQRPKKRKVVLVESVVYEGAHVEVQVSTGAFALLARSTESTLPDSPQIFEQTQECMLKRSHQWSRDLFAFLACVKVSLSCQLGEICNHLGGDLWVYPIYFEWGEQICPP